MDHKFQINLRGLSTFSRTTSTAAGGVRGELLQNGVDALRPRSYLEPDHRGEIAVEVHAPRGKPPTLTFSDNGIGLTEEEVHRFLATIGETSKRPDLWDRPVDFIGRFGMACSPVSSSATRSSSSRAGPRPIGR